MFRFSNIVLAMVILIASAVAAQAQDAPKREITQISGDLYRFKNNFHYSVFLVTPDGVIVTDPINADAAQWLKAEIASRFGKPIRYVVYSHDHRDHIAGGEVFAADGAIVVAHEKAKRAIIGEKRPTAVPDITFEESLDLFLGDLQVRLLYFGPTHSDNLIQVHIPGEGVLVATDMAKGKSLFPDYRDMDVHNTLKALGKLAALENVDVVLPGHGRVTNQQNFADSRRFIQSLHDQVLAYQVEGKSLAEIRQLVTMSDFSDYRGLESWLDINIVTMYNYLYRYREPNSPITPFEAVRCREDVNDCRTSNKK